MPVLKMPDGQTVDFGDNVPPEQILQMIRSKFPDFMKDIDPPSSNVQPVTKESAKKEKGFDAKRAVKAVGRGVGLTTDAIIKGTTTLPAMVGDFVLKDWRLGPEAQRLPSLFDIRDRALSRVLPQPSNAKEKLISSTVQGAAVAPTSPLMALSGASAGYATEKAAQNNIPPVGQIGIGIAAGMLPGGVRYGVKSLLDAANPKNTTNVEKLSPLTTASEEVSNLRDVYKKVTAQEDKLWAEARTSSSGVAVPGDTAQRIGNEILSYIESQKLPLDSDSIKPVLEQVSQILKLNKSVKGGDIPELLDMPLSDLLSIRRNLSELSGSAKGQTRHVAGHSVGLIDKAIEDGVKTGTIDRVAGEKALGAIAATRDKYSTFFANKDEAKIFEDLVTSKTLTEAQIKSISGGALRENKEMFIKKAIEVGGERSRERIARMYFEEAVRDATKVSDTGVYYVSADRLSSNLNNLINTDTNLGPTLRSKVFTKEEMSNIKSIIDNAPKNSKKGFLVSEAFKLFRGAKELSRVQMKPNVRLGVKTKEYISPMLGKPIKEIKVKPKEKSTSKLMTGVTSATISKQNEKEKEKNK